MFFNCFFTFLFYFTNIYIDPSNSNDSKASQKLNKALFSAKEALELFKDYKINDLADNKVYLYAVLTINLLFIKRAKRSLLYQRY